MPAFESSSLIPKAMSIAGSDSGAGAGIQADLKTFAAFDVYGTTAVTAVTAQNTIGVLAIAEVPEEVIAAQIDCVLEDIGADAAKTGMLSSSSIISVVAERIEAWGIDKFVVDPVMVAKSGDYLLQPEAVNALKGLLAPLALVITPNIPEAEVLSGIPVTDSESAQAAARRIHELGPKYVVIKGGHREGPPVDLVFDGTDLVELESDRIETDNTHGTGCTFSAAITAGLARGESPLAAIHGAKAYLTEALKASYSIGGGHSPVNHFHAIHYPPTGA